MWIATTVFVIFHLIGFLSSIDAVMSTRTSQGAIAWALSLNTFPLIAVPAYWILGRNRFQGYVNARQDGDHEIRHIALHARDQTMEHRSERSSGNAAAHTAEQLAQIPYLSDNHIELLIDGHAKSESEFPLFLYLAYPAPHTPWLPSAEFVGKSGASMYGDFVMTVDHNVGRVLRRLESAGLSDDTLVIFTSDNGPVWYDEDVARFGHDSSGGLRGMKADAWEGGHRMPFIARWPGQAQAGSTCDQLICFTDLLATFAQMNDIQLPSDAGPDSFSILPLLTGSDQSVRTSLVMRSGGGHMMVRKGDWKLIDALGSGGFSKPSKVKAEK